MMACVFTLGPLETGELKYIQSQPGLHCEFWAIATSGDSDSKVKIYTYICMHVCISHIYANICVYKTYMFLYVIYMCRGTRLYFKWTISFDLSLVIRHLFLSPEFLLWFALCSKSFRMRTGGKPLKNLLPEAHPGL